MSIVVPLHNAWYPDSGAINHITPKSDINNVPVLSYCHGLDPVMVVNGFGLEISQIGNSITKHVHTSRLEHVLVLSLKKNLYQELSVLLKTIVHLFLILGNLLLRILPQEKLCKAGQDGGSLSDASPSEKA